MILYGTNLGNANTHVTTNMPTLFAGGGFRHGSASRVRPGAQLSAPESLRLDAATLGLETTRFASATGTMRGLETALA